MNSYEAAAPDQTERTPFALAFDTVSSPTLSFARIDRGDETILCVEGAFDAQSAPQIRSALDAVVAEKRPEVAVDLSALSSIDSSGIGAVVSLYKRVRAQGGRVYVKGLHGQPLAIFRLLRLDRVLVS